MNALVFIPCFRPASKAASASGVALKLLSIGLESGEVSGCLFLGSRSGSFGGHDMLLRKEVCREHNAGNGKRASGTEWQRV